MVNFISSVACKKVSSFKCAIFALILIVFSSGCITQKKCLKKFPASVDTVKIVITKDSIIYRDTTILIHLPGATVTDTVIIPCPPPPPAYVPDTARAETSLAVAKAWWKHPNIVLQLIQKDTTIERRLDSAIMEAYHWRSEYEKVTVTQPVKYIPKFYLITTYIFIGFLVFFMVWVVWRLAR